VLKERDMATTLRIKPRTRRPRDPWAEMILVSKEEGVAMLDEQARESLGLSGEEFIQKYRAGELGDADCSEVARLSILIPFAEQDE
jgi:hypothetical protein